jgi:hypothetical protein
MDRDNVLLQVRWRMALERYIADYSEPPSANGYYSIRTPRKLRNRLGREFKPGDKHLLVWSALVLLAHDLTKSVTHTWIGKETLKQLSGQSGTLYSETLDDLEAVGFVTIDRRLNQTNQINLHLVPVEKGHEKDYVVEPVSIAPEDLGIYVCEAARKRGESVSIPADDESDNDVHAVAQVVKLVESAFPEHPNFTNKRQRDALSRYASGWIKIAGSGEDCHAALWEILADRSEAGLATYSNIAVSNSLGAYITKAFPAWWDAYAARQQNADVIDTF